MRVKGLRRYGIVWRVGAPEEADASPRTKTKRKQATMAYPTGKVDLIVDLQADKKVTLSAEWTDEVGNPVDAPANATAVYTVDDTSIINLTDNGDGTATAAATGALGTATVHGEFTTDDVVLTGDLALVVVAGLAERVNLVAGDPEEVTP